MVSYVRRYGLVGLADLVMCTSETQQNLSTDVSGDTSVVARGYDVVRGADGGKEIYDPVILDEQQGVQILLEEIALSSYKGKANTENIEVILENPVTGKYDLVLHPDVLFWKKEGDTLSYLEFVGSGEAAKGVISDFPFYREILPGTEKEIREKMKLYLQGKK